MTQRKISPDDLICMNEYAHTHHFQVNLAYAKDDNLLFQEQIYNDTARLYLHKILAQITKRAAKNCHQNTGYSFVLHDGLRTVNAQEKMMKTKRARENPHWMEPPRLLSQPGGGAHPRGMAIDISLIDQNGHMLDMGCPFDYLCDSPYADRNPAHRDYNHLPQIIDNRDILNRYMIEAAEYFDTKLLLLPEEWWDFRLEPKFYNEFTPIRDEELPIDIRLTDI